MVHLRAGRAFLVAWTASEEPHMYSLANVLCVYKHIASVD